jgi:alkylhydroperoxidase family enzyme
LLGESLVRQALDDWRSAPLNPRQRAALGFLEKLTLVSAEVTAQDLLPLRQAGLDDQAIHEAGMVCFLFSIMNRLAEALGFDLPSEEQNRQAARAIRLIGYRQGPKEG